MASSPELTRKIRAPFGQSSGTVSPHWFGRRNLAFDNDFEFHGAYKDGSDAKPVCGIAETDDVLIAGGKLNPRLTPICCSIATAGQIATQRFHVHPTIPNLARMRIEAISISWETAESTASACTLQVTKEESGQGPGAGHVLLQTAINVKGTAATPANGTLVTDVRKLTLRAGDMLSFLLSAASTELAGLCITVWVSPGHVVNFASFYINATGSQLDSTFAVFNRPTTALAVSYVHSILGTDGSAVTVMPERQVGTEDEASGDAMMAAGFNCKAAINVPQHGTLVTTAAIVRSKPADRLAADFTGTLTALAGTVMTMAYSAWEDAVEAQIFMIDTGAAVVDRTIAIVRRDFAIVGGMATWRVAGGASNVQLTLDETAEAAGAGHNLLSQDSAAGFQTDGTAEVPEEAALVVTPSLHFGKDGDRVSMDSAGTLTNLEGLVIGVMIAPR